MAPSDLQPPGAAVPMASPTSTTFQNPLTATPPPSTPNTGLPENVAAKGPSVPSPSEASTAAYVYELFHKARNARRPMVAQWKRNYRTLHNKVWTARAEAWMPSPEVAQVFPVIFSSVAWMTDQRPVTQVTPSPQPFSEYADFYQALATDMNTILSANYMAYDLDMEINKVLWDVKTYGIGYTKQVWEAWQADGLGDALFRRVSPFNIYPDPHANSPTDLTYIIEAKTMTTSDVDRAWPGAAKRLTGNTTAGIDEQPTKLEESVSAMAPRVALGNLPSSTNTRYAVGAQRDRAPGITDDPICTILECWVRSHHAIDTDDPAVKKVTDEWRCIVVCGNIVLSDKPAGEITAYNTHPYDRMVLVDVGEWYGPCLVEMLDSPQESIGRILTAIEQNIALMGNPMLVESPRSQSKNKRISNRPGQRIDANPDQVAWLNPPQMHPQMAVNLIQFYKSEIESISGLSAMVRGFSPSGRNAQGVLDTVQDAAFVRVRATLRQLEALLRGVSSKMCATIAEFYTEPRVMSHIGQDGQRTNLALRGRHFYTRDADNPDQRIPMRFQLLADAGSQLPTSKQARAAEAERMFALGAVDVYELLKAKQWPNYALVANRVMSQMAQAGAAAQQAPGRRRA